MNFPKPSNEFVGTTVGVCGLAAISVAIGFLTQSYWWALLAAGMFGVFVAYLIGRETS